MNKDQVEGKAREVAGKAKQAVADLKDDPNLHDEGTVDEAAGKAQAKYGEAKEKLGEAVKDLGDRIKK
jgi:uncharacterized protein YjbJ (UPF0337 family)